MPLAADNAVRHDYERVLDIGCGVGYTSKELVRRFQYAVIDAIDYDEKQIRIARKKWAPDLSDRLRFHVGDGKNLNFPNGYFDAVFAFDVMHHIESYETAVSEVYRVLKRGGDLYVVDVDKRVFNVVIGWLDNTQSFFSREEFIEVVKRNAFDVKKSGEKGIFFYAICRK